MSLDKKISILVNSSDGYEDCWFPFFFLLRKNWLDCGIRIYLNTGIKTWKSEQFPDLICTQIEKDSINQLTWSECLSGALDLIDTPFVLYFQEDYFIDKKVDEERIKKAVDFMVENPQVEHIALTRHCSYGPYAQLENYDWLQVIPQNAKYRISTQAAIWRVQSLKSYINPAENGWLFEICGSWRSSRKKATFLSAKWDELNCGPVIDYVHTGIIKGKWHPEIINLFSKNSINIDYNKRKFYLKKNNIVAKLDLLYKIMASPRHFIVQFFRQCLSHLF